MSKLFSLLNNFYGSKNPWIEVEEELKKAGKEFSSDDFLNPFNNLIIGILSQNTSDRNSTRAYISLINAIGKINLQTILDTSLAKIKTSIKPGGLYNLKAKRIKDLSKAILKNYNGDLTRITKLSEEKAREKLLKLPGIGPKTADIFIGYCMEKDTFPIDTNINRVIKRIGIVNQKADYYEMQTAIAKIIPKEQRLTAHELLIRLGRDICKPRNPSCDTCPINSVCKKIL